MKIRIILSTAEGEIGRQTIDRQTIEADETSLTDDIAQALKCWDLAPGDTIKIVEVS
jgi:hypothetical protein